LGSVELAAVESSEQQGDLAEVDEAFVRCQVGFVVAVDAAAVVDPAVGAFDDPTSRLDDEAVAGFRVT
jgi:hypothetical protein